MGMDSRRFILCVLLVTTYAGGRRARMLIGMTLKEEDDDPKHLQKHPVDDNSWIYSKYEDHLNKKHTRDDDDDLRKHAHYRSQMEHVEAADNIFFTLDGLRVGKTLPVYFSSRDPANSPHLLPREEASSIPFSLAQLPYLLGIFSLSKESPRAKAMEYTLRTCEVKPMKGETKLCATSLESMLDFARATFGPDTQLKVLTTNHLTKFSAGVQNYTILEEPKEILAPKKIGCHTMPFPYVVYYCHSQESGNRLFEILLGGETGEKVQAAGICHMDTSQWHPDSPSFRVLRIKPGTAPVCHFFPADNIVWVPLTA